MNFQTSDGKISAEEFVKLFKFLDKNLLVGAEMEGVIIMGHDTLASHLNTSFIGYGSSHGSGDNIMNLYKTARARNKFNVAFLTSDCTFDGNNEIIYGGNNEDFFWNYDKLKLIEDKLTSLRALKYNFKTSTHITCLTAHNCRINPIVIKNIFNIVRAFTSSFYWLGSGDSNTIIRSGTSGMAMDSLGFSPNDRSAFDLINLINKYHIVNLSKQQTCSEGNQNYLNGILVEFRGIDGIRIPSVISALFALYKALIYKAVEFSTQGIIQVESLSSNWNLNKSITKKLLENTTLIEAEKEWLRVESKRLINLLSDNIKRQNKGALPVLNLLADKPASMRLKEGKSNEEVDSELFSKPKGLNAKETEMLSFIINNEITAESFGEWKKKTAEKSSCSVRYVEKMLLAIIDHTRLNLVFDEDKKGMRFD